MNRKHILDALLRWIGTPLLVAALAGGVIAVSKATVDPRLEARNEALRAELGRVQARNARLAAQIAELKGEIHRLRTQPEESLHHARTQLGMVRSGEVVYQFAGPIEAPAR